MKNKNGLIGRRLILELFYSDMYKILHEDYLCWWLECDKGAERRAKIRLGKWERSLLRRIRVAFSNAEQALEKLQ